MGKKYTHVLTVAIGLDLTKILAPESIPGVKALLGVEKDTELLDAVASDKYKKIVSTLNNAGYDVIDANFRTIPTEKRAVPDSNEEEISSNKPVKSRELNMDNFTKALVISLKKSVEEFTKAKKEIVKVDISSRFIDRTPSFDVIREKVELPEDVELDFDELDDDIVVMISYVENEKIEFKGLKENELKEELAVG